MTSCLDLGSSVYFKSRLEQSYFIAKPYQPCLYQMYKLKKNTQKNLQVEILILEFVRFLKHETPYSFINFSDITLDLHLPF